MKDQWKNLIDYGVKPMGSKNLYRAGIYLKGIMETICCDVSIYEYPEEGWEPISWELSDESGKKIQAYPFLESGSCDKFEGYVRYAGCHRVWAMYVWKRYMLAGEDGEIKAYVTVRGNGNAIPQMLFAKGELPHFLVGAEDEKTLEEARVENRKIRGSIRTRKACRSVCRNISGYLGEGDEKVVLCAHYDTVYSTCGAYDNAAGVAVILEAARRIKSYKFHSRIQLLLTDGEEFDLRGSRHQAVQDEENINFVLNVDGVGRENVLEVWSGPESFERKIRAVLDRSNEDFHAEYICPPPPGSDHAPYYDKGIDACMLTFNDQGILHTPEDIYEESKLKNMEKMVKIVIEVLEGLHVIEKM